VRLDVASPGVYKNSVYRFGDQVKSWRERARLSQKQLAAALGVTQQTVSDWERNKILPAAERATEFEQALGLPPQTVLLALFEVLQGKTIVLAGPDGPAEARDRDDPRLAALAGGWHRLSEEDRELIAATFERLRRDRTE
jgi:transcriptional regulator with XRE-family HTH domain